MKSYQIIKKMRSGIMATFFFLLFIGIWGCEDPFPEPPGALIVSYIIDGKAITLKGGGAFAETYLWDFGDGSISNEKDPTHTFTDGGYYTIVLKTQNDKGSATDTLKTGIALDPYILLTGGANDADGKTWRLSKDHSGSDRYVLCDADLNTKEIPMDNGQFLNKSWDKEILGNAFGIPEVYNNEFTFYHDGRYVMDLKEDKTTLAMVRHIFENSLAIANSNQVGQYYGLVTAVYVVPDNASFTYTESKDLTVSTFDVASQTKKDIGYPGVSTLSFSEKAFVGLFSAKTEVVIEDISDDKMRLRFYVFSGNPDLGGAVYPDSNIAIALTFEALP